MSTRSGVPTTSRRVLARSFFNKGIVATLVAALIGTSAMMANAATGEETKLFYSNASDRSNARALTGATLTTRPVYVFLAKTDNVQEVTFSLDGKPVRVERQAPYDVGGTAPDGSARALDLMLLTRAKHVLSAKVTKSNGRIVEFRASFRISDVVSGNPGTTTTVKPTTTTVKSTTTTIKPTTTTTAPTPTTVKPTTTTTTKPSSSNGIWRPSKGLTWQWQLTTPVDTSFDVDAYNIDGFENGTSVVSAIHARGSKAICYISAGSYEDWRPDASSFPSQVLGKSNGWAGEKWLDVRAVSTLQPIMAKRVDMCANKGFDAVEFDNVDGFTNSTGFALTGAHQLVYNKMLAGLAHAKGMAAVLKNDGDQASQLEPYFEIALNEQCFEYDECEAFEPFLAAGKPVLVAEYELSTSQFCGKARSMGISAMRKNLDLDAFRQAC